MKEVQLTEHLVSACTVNGVLQHHSAVYSSLLKQEDSYKKSAYLGSLCQLLRDPGQFLLHRRLLLLESAHIPGAVLTLSQLPHDALQGFLQQFLQERQQRVR